MFEFVAVVAAVGVVVAIVAASAVVAVVAVSEAVALAVPFELCVSDVATFNLSSCCCNVKL